MLGCQDDVDLTPGVLGNHAVLEVEELHPAAALVVPGLDESGGHLERGEQRGRAMPGVFVIEARQRLAVGQLEPPLGALERLDVGLLVDRQHHRVVRRIQVQRDDVGGLLRKLRIGADAPAAPPLQGDVVAAQHAPDVVLGDVLQPLREQCPVPARVALGRGLVQRRQDPTLVLWS